MIVTLLAVLFLIAGSVLFAEISAPWAKHGEPFIRWLPKAPRITTEHLPRMRRAFAITRILFAALSAAAIIGVLFSMSAQRLPSLSFTIATVYVLLLWSSLQFPGSYKVELRSFSALFVFTMTFPWLMLLVDEIINVHPSILFGFSKPLQSMGIEDPSSIQLAWFVTLCLSGVAALSRLSVALMFSLPALIFGLLVQYKVKKLGSLPNRPWIFGTVSAFMCILGLVLAW